MAWVQADLDAINTAIATGAKRVRFQTHEVEYQSIDALLKARQIIADELNSRDNSGGPLFAEYGSAT